MKSKLLVLGSSLMCLAALTGCSTHEEVEIEHAALNTLLGMGMAFSVLILISLLISLFPLITKVQNAAMTSKDNKKKEEYIDNIDSAISRIEEQEEMADNAELVAVISAAIAAYEGTSGADGFQVRSIRKVNKNNWKRA